MIVKYLFFKIKYFLKYRIKKNSFSFGYNCKLHVGGQLLVFKKLSAAARISFGNNIYIGRNFDFHTGSLISIGNGVVISDFVYMSTVAHGINPQDGLIMEQDWQDKGSIIIGDNTFVGYGVKILPAVNLGHNCVIGAGSVVAKSFPPYSMIVGNPAKIIKTFDFVKNDWVPI